MNVRLVPPAGAEPGKLTAEEVDGLWASLTPVSPEGEAYLGRRGLWDASEQFLRFNHAEVPNRSLLGLFRAGYLIATPLTDVLGDKRGLLLRLARDARGDESATRSVKGSTVGGAFLGSPQLIEASPVVCVTEGLTDTVSVLGWTSAVDGVCVVGAPSRGLLPRLAKELEAAGVAVEGKLFALFVKNDRPKNESRREFVRLSQLLLKRGARTALVRMEDEFPDVASWRQAHPEAEWPPAEVHKAMSSAGESSLPPAAALPPGLAVAIPAEVRTEHYAQDFTTLCTLLDDPMHREAIMGRGELSWCEMTWRVRLAGRELAEVDLSTIRLGLEAQGRSTDGKPLKFAEEDIAKALKLISRKRTVHPVRDWLKGLKWDGTERIDGELAQALGHAADSFEARLLYRWMLSAVARAMEPGCKVDTVLVLTGPEKRRKSTFFEILGGEWFTDTPVHVGDKDGKLVMRRAWLIEWGELSAMRRAADQEAIKAFISQRTEWFREPYGRTIASAPRHAVIVGSTNHEEFLTDPTGSRRFWAIPVKKEIAYRWVRENREQLWAEATALYLAAESCPECRPTLPFERCAAHQWWLTDEEDALRAERNAAHEEQHPWMDVVRDWLDAHLVFAEVTPDQVLIEAVGMEHKNIRNSDQQAAGRLLRKLGWTRVRRSSGRVIRWVYVRRPEEENT